MAPKKNGFYYFMLEIIRREKERGVTCTKAAAQNIADPEWKAMTSAQKQKYNDMAKRQNELNKHDLSKKFTSLGKSFAAVDNDERARAEALNVMSMNIKHCVEDLNHRNELKSHPFFVAHVNYYYRTDENYYAPAEFALAVFSFEKGSIDTLHFFIDAGEIPLGYSFPAKDHSEKVHQIPVLYDDNWEGEKMDDWYNMLCRVINFIESHSGSTDIPPIYTMCDSLNYNYSHSAVHCALDRMCDSHNMDHSYFRVYHLDKLFHEVISAVRPGLLLSTALMRAEIEKDPFSYARDLGCYFHEEQDISVFCSLAMVIRWIFTMCDHCCKYMGIQLILGSHVPRDVDVNWQKSNVNSLKKNEDTSQYASVSTTTSLPFFEPDVSSRGGRREGSRRYDSDNSQTGGGSYSSKIGARFDTSSVASDMPDSTSEALDSAAEDSADSDWSTVERKRIGMGRGKGIHTEAKKPQLPTSGRGRLAAMKK